jgi:hypothetical protein
MQRERSIGLIWLAAHFFHRADRVKRISVYKTHALTGIETRVNQPPACCSEATLFLIVIVQRFSRHAEYHVSTLPRQQDEKSAAKPIHMSISG